MPADLPMYVVAAEFKDAGQIVTAVALERAGALRLLLHCASQYRTDVQRWNLYAYPATVPATVGLPLPQPTGADEMCLLGWLAPEPPRAWPNLDDSGTLPYGRFPLGPIGD